MHRHLLLTGILLSSLNLYPRPLPSATSPSIFGFDDLSFTLSILVTGITIAPQLVRIATTLTSHKGASFLHMSVIWRCTLGRTLVKTRPNSR